MKVTQRMRNDMNEALRGENEVSPIQNLEEKMTQIFQEEGDFALGEEISKWGPGTLRGILMNSPDLSGEEVREVPDEDLIDCVSRMWIH